MAKLTRITNILFGSSAPSQTIEQFGSFTLDSVPNYTTDPAVIQARSAWVNGWTTAINAGNKAPYVQDQNAVDYVFSYQLSYLFQAGIPEWDTATVYYTNSVVQYNGQWFISLQDSNTGNTPPASATNAFWGFVNVPFVTVGSGIKVNLVVAPNGGAPTTKTDVTADLLSVQGVSIPSLSKTADITVSGAGGLDTGAPANNTWYAVHIISNASGGLVSIIYSLSATAPTLPAGYTLFRRVGWVRRDGAGNFRAFTRTGDWVYYKTPNSYASPTGASFSFAVDMPTTSILAQFGLLINGITPGGQNWGTLFFTTPGESNQTTVLGVGLTGSTQRQGAVSEFRTNTSQAIDIATDNLGSAPWTVTVLGYSDPV